MITSPSPSSKSDYRDTIDRESNRGQVNIKCISSHTFSMVPPWFIPITYFLPAQFSPFCSDWSNILTGSFPDSFSFHCLSITGGKMQFYLILFLQCCFDCFDLGCIHADNYSAPSSPTGGIAHHVDSLRGSQLR